MVYEFMVVFRRFNKNVPNAALIVSLQMFFVMRRCITGKGCEVIGRPVVRLGADRFPSSLASQSRVNGLGYF